ncbi:putative hemolysin [Acidomonas methanolica]|uniref:Hemolysin n=1 Tax=Acidomonas methanolica NBRC 104435 TaxID=1231351 RepID=A0A023D7M4_ACIMT|nr:DUF333 domain-containing protein [Acidomonas methanolica]MBU2655269.1 DUF333 domain-containing protein [Acidomonas methanolica]TCS24064.1 hypothetical protein EDC31_12621 [Acidomonas methanolica]GAJ29781.1 hypothetical protein Amme_078_013 [Acidomonas methanolica NBRC 104435]GBQ51676.1 hypothetical protein AA0498_1542 [Acidomonas methanolica]GEL00111.1 hypothetical protein AME01nite_26090 [Acidomonas methanolica NBRC 104435]
MKPLSLAALTILSLAGCTTTHAPGPVGMPNPASVHCVQRGGTLEIRNAPGGQTGYCHLPDGRVVEEWALFRQDRKQ